MRTRTLETEIWLPRPIDDVFAFFSDAGNLDALTPPWLSFQILTPKPLALAAGALIDYRLKLHGIPVRWRTEITHWEPPHKFIDEQKKGPYSLWIHEHLFEEHEGGTRIRDHVTFAVPGWICEPLLARFLVVPDLRTVFAYRHQRLRALLAPTSRAVETQIVFKVI